MSPEDRTELSQLEKTLIEQEDHYIIRLVEESPVAMIISTGAEEQSILVNSKFTELFGYTIEDLPDISHWWPRAYPDPEYREKNKTAWSITIKQAIKNRSKIEPIEAMVTCKDGSHRYIKFYFSSIGEQHLVTFIDLTERKRMESSFHLMTMALNKMYDAAFLIDEHARFHYVNDEACRMLGYSRKDMLSLTIFDIDPDIKREDWSTMWSEIRKEVSYTFERRLKTRDGYIVPVESNSKIFEYDGRDYNLSMVRDISVRKEEEREQLAYLHFFASLDKVNQAIQGTNDLEQMMSDVLDTVLEIFNCDRAYLLYPCDPDAPSWQVPMERTRPDYPGVLAMGLEIPIVPDAVATFRLLNASNGPVKFGPGSEYPLPKGISARFDVRSFIAMALHPKVGKTWQFGLHQCSFPRIWTTEEERLMQGIGRRLTDALTSFLTYRDLRESEEKFKSLAASAQDAIIVIDNDGFVRYWNSAAERIFGWKAEKIMGNNIQVAMAPGQSYDAFTKGIAEFKKNGSGAVPGKVWEINARRKNSQEFPVELSISGLFLQGAWHAICIVRDITERKKLEEQLLQAQKMEAIGSLAGGIAHDFNNILTAITGYSSFIKMKMNPNNPFLPSIDIILSSAERAAQLIKGLLAFSRKQVINPKLVELNSIISNVEKILKRLIGEDIDFSTRFVDANLMVMADVSQIEQVLMNLATNARDAMPDGGVLTIVTRKVNLDYDFINAHGYGKPGMYTQITVSDTGTGIDEMTREKIFDPFFTTKETGKGTGLGLSIVYGIVKQHEGHINVYSEAGTGTTFTIYLPLASEEAEGKTDGPSPSLRGGNETILLVEDDEAVRTMTGFFLSDFGYHVIDAIDGMDAIEKFSLYKNKIKLVVLDVIMPKKSGKEVFDVIKTIRPDIEVLFISGYPADFLDKKGLLDKTYRLILKPISPHDILQKIREILDQKK